MGRGGPGLWDSDSVWDLASEFSDLVGVDLTLAGMTDIPREEEDPPILSIKDTAKHMNGRRFDIMFDTLKEKDSTYALIIFVGLCMKVGVKIKKKQKTYLKRVYADIEEFEHLPESREQVKCALEEYVSGEPYTFKNFDFSEDPPEEPKETTKTAGQNLTPTTKSKNKPATGKKRARSENEEEDKENTELEEKNVVQEQPSKRGKVALSLN